MLTLYSVPQELPGGAAIMVEQCQCLFPDLNGDCIVQGEEVLDFYEYEDVKIWAWYLVMIGMIVFLRFVFYVLLRMANKGKR